MHEEPGVGRLISIFSPVEPVKASFPIPLFATPQPVTDCCCSFPLAVTVVLPTIPQRRLLSAVMKNKHPTITPAKNLSSCHLESLISSSAPRKNDPLIRSEPPPRGRILI